MGTAFKLRNGSLLLTTEAPGGIYNSEQLKKIATLADNDAAIVKVTEDQRLALFVSEESAGDIANELRNMGLGIRHYQDGLHQPTACIGELCPEVQQDALGASMKISEALSTLSTDSPLKIGINGCSNCCVPCHTLDISLVGDEGGYRMSLGGKNSQIPEMATFMAEGVPESELPEFINKIILLYKEHAEAGESLQEVMDRVGPSRFAEILSPYSQDAAASEDDLFGGSDSHTEPDPGSETPDLAAAEDDLSAEAADDLSVGADESLETLSEEGSSLDDDELMSLENDDDLESIAGLESDVDETLGDHDSFSEGLESEELSVQVDEMGHDIESETDPDSTDLDDIELPGDDILSSGEDVDDLSGLEETEFRTEESGMSELEGVSLEGSSEAGDAGSETGLSEHQASTETEAGDDLADEDLSSDDDLENLDGLDDIEGLDDPLSFDGGSQEDLSAEGADIDSGESDLVPDAGTDSLSDMDLDLDDDDGIEELASESVDDAASDPDSGIAGVTGEPELSADETVLAETDDEMDEDIPVDLGGDFSPDGDQQDASAEMELGELGQETEADLEERLSQDIDHSRYIHEPDYNETDRDAAIRNLEENSEADPGASGAGDPEDPIDSADLDDPGTDVTDDVTDTEPETENISTLRDSSPQGSDSEEDEFEGLSFTESGDLRLSFSSGISLQINPALLSEHKKKFFIGKHKLALSMFGGEAHIEFEDGLIMSLPASAA